MRVPLLCTLRAGSPEDALFPGLDYNSQVLFSSRDGTARSNVTIDTVQNADEVNNRVETTFGIAGLPKNAWQLTFTESRLIFWSPFVAGLIGNKAKQKSGSASAGHLYYKSIAFIRISNPGNDYSYICVACIRMDGTFTNMMCIGDVPALRETAQLLARYLADYYKSAGNENDELSKQLDSLRGFEWNDMMAPNDLFNIPLFKHFTGDKVWNSRSSAI